LTQDAKVTLEDLQKDGHSFRAKKTPGIAGRWTDTRKAA
jgi:hypothetical protein